MKSKKTTITYSLIGLIVIIFGIITIYKFIKYNENQDYVLKINGEHIFQDEVDLYINFAKNQMERSANIKTPEEKEKFWTQTFEGINTLEYANQKAMNSLIQNKVTLQHGKKMRLKITPEEETEKIRQIKNLWQELEIEAVTDNAINLFSKDLLMANKVFETITEGIVLTEQDILSEYNIYNVRQILFDKKNTKLAEQILERIKKGEEFEKFLAYSIDKTNDGKYSFYNDQLLNNNYERAVTNLKVGQVSSTVETQEGIYIIKLESLEKPSGQILTEIKLKYSEEILNKKCSDKYDNQVKIWIDEANIEIK